MSEDWPTCVCADCIRCGCNLPWKHHGVLSEVDALESFGTAMLVVARLTALVMPGNNTVEVIQAIADKLKEVPNED